MSSIRRFLLRLTFLRSGGRTRIKSPNITSIIKSHVDSSAAAYAASVGFHDLLIVSLRLAKDTMPLRAHDQMQGLNPCELLPLGPLPSRSIKDVREVHGLALYPRKD